MAQKYGSLRVKKRLKGEARNASISDRKEHPMNGVPLKSYLPMMALTLFAAPAFAQQETSAAPPTPPVVETPAATDAPAPPTETKPEGRRFWVGPDFGFYYPTADNARRALRRQVFFLRLRHRRGRESIRKRAADL